MASTVSPTHSLEVRRTIRASPERIYDAWTTAEALTRWFAPSADFTTVVHAAELRVGGHYRIEMRHSSGASHVAVGTYRELARPTRLSFSWRWEGTAMADSLVTIELSPAGPDTELVLTHGGFSTEAERDEHLKGWNGCLARIDSTAAAATQ
jgi:uncharacterized protein YndB with AHSA1/START domain